MKNRIKITRISPDPMVVYDSEKEVLDGATERYLVEWEGMVDRPMDADGQKKEFMVSTPPQRKAFNGPLANV